MVSETKDNPPEGTSIATQVDNGYEMETEASLTEAEAMALAEKHGVEFINLSDAHLSSHIVWLLPQELVTEHNCLAVRFENDTLYVAMTNPVDLPTLDQINLVTGFNVKPIVATERDIVRAISQHYGARQMTKQDLVDARFDQESTQQIDTKTDSLILSDDKSQVAKLVNSIIKDAIDSLASDIHFEPASTEMFVRFRVDGILHDCLTVPTAMRKEVTSRLKVLAKLDITEKRKAQDGHISLKYRGNDYDLRVSVIPTINGEKTVIRVLDKNRMATNLTALGINPWEMELVENAISRPYGMVLVTGPTGSGKTTSLYAMLQGIDAIGKNVITIENPVEYKLDRINQIQIDPDTGQTFAEALRSILRQDPDVVMLGEIRDEETAEIAVQAALTGHLVLSTLHTNDAVTAITRLRELGIPPFLISSCVVMAVAQRLVRKVCPDCKQAYQPDEKILKTLNLLDVAQQPDKEFVHGKGCKYCYETGFKGREGVFEILRVDDEIQNEISQDKSALEIKKTAVKRGMKTLMDSAIVKVLEGKTSVEEVRRVIAPESF